MTDHPPGRELDALVATEVMGRKVQEQYCYGDPHSSGWVWTIDQDEAHNDPRAGTDDPWFQLQPCMDDGDGWWDPVPAFSTDITPAMEALEVAAALPCWPMMGKTEPSRWLVTIHGGNSRGVIATAFSDTLPHAISLAALKAVGWAQ